VQFLRARILLVSTILSIASVLAAVATALADNGPGPIPH
jgi:hypothetical protein